MNAIEIRNLSKSFRGLYAVDHLNMTVPVGAIYGFIGENGSGKSTTEKLICGLQVPDRGSIRLFGRDYRDGDVRAKVGVLIGLAGGAIMLIAFFAGAMVGGAISGLPFDTGTAGAGGIIMCMISKIFLAAVFVSIDNTPGFRDHECYHVPCRRDLVQSGDRPGEQCRTE